MAGSCEYSNEPPGSIQSWEFPECPSYSCLPTEEWTPWNLLHSLSFFWLFLLHVCKFSLSTYMGPNVVCDHGILPLLVSPNYYAYIIGSNILHFMVHQFTKHVRVAAKKLHSFPEGVQSKSRPGHRLYESSQPVKTNSRKLLLLCNDCFRPMPF
jgi:hypothetical protein